jgi:hypothetical protein
MPQFAFIGDSGRTYVYALADADNPSTITPQGGNYILAMGTGGGDPKIVYAGQADSILREIVTTSHWNHAKANHGADLIYVHPQLNPRARVVEKDDLVRGHHPPMNP